MWIDEALAMHRRRITALAIPLVLAACGTNDDVRTDDRSAPPDSVLPAAAASPELEIDTLARGLVVPWGVAFARDGRVFVTERPGRIRIIRDGTLDSAVWATLDVHADDPQWGPESGLLGIALAPDFATSGHVYIMATVWRSSGDRRRTLGSRLWRRVAGAVDPANALTFKHQIIRFTERDGRGVDPLVIVDDLPANHYHAGGALAFGPDGMLYASVGDAILPHLAQQHEALIGKILRFTPDGTVPRDNPDSTSPVWSLGVRNPQAFTWSEDGTMFGVDHGPTAMAQEDFRSGQDKLIVVVAGANYGWPVVTGWRGLERYERSVWVWQTSIAPSGVAFYRGAVSEWQGSIFVAGLHGRVERLVLDRRDNRWSVGSRETLIDGAFGRVRTIVVGPEGSLYVTTSNRARGVARPGDDLVLRLTPRVTPRGR